MTGAKIVYVRVKFLGNYWCAILLLLCLPSKLFRLTFQIHFIRLGQKSSKGSQIRTIEQIAEDPYLDLYRLTAPIIFVVAISPS